MQSQVHVLVLLKAPRYLSSQGCLFVMGVTTACFVGGELRTGI